MQKNKLYLTVILLLCLSIVGICLLLSCKNKKPIKIGFSGCLTGKLSDLGISGRNGVQLAIDEINASGGIHGRPVELIVKDDRHDAETAMQVDKELIEEAGVVAIIGHMTSSMTMAVMPMINKAKIVMISPTASTNELTGIDDYFFRVIPSNKDETDHLATYAFHRMGLKTIAFVYDLSNKSYGEGWYLNFKSEYEKMGGNILYTETYASDPNIDYLRIVENIIDKNFDALIIVGGAIDTAMICQQLRKKNFNKLIIGSGWSRTDELIPQGGSAVEGIVYSDMFDHESQQSYYVEFKKKFWERFGKPPDFAAANGYESVQLLVKALKDSNDYSDVKASILEQKTFEGLQITIEMDRYGDAIRPRFLTTVKDGKFVMMDE